MKKFFNANNETLITVSEILFVEKQLNGTNAKPDYILTFIFLNGANTYVHYGNNYAQFEKDYNELINLIVE